MSLSENTLVKKVQVRNSECVVEWEYTRKKSTKSDRHVGEGDLHGGYGYKMVNKVFLGSATRPIQCRCHILQRPYT